MDDLAATRMTNELDMSFVMFVSCSVLSLDQHLTYFLFVSNINHSIYIEWLVTHFSPHGWGKMGHSRNKKRGLPPLKFVF